jgi:hypothetical protein
MRITTTEAKALTGTKDNCQAFDNLYNRLTRRTWVKHGVTYTPAGYTWHSRDGAQAFHLTAIMISPVHGAGCVFHVRIKLSLSEALDCISGQFENVSRA